jgi:hypothetical protein
MRRRTCLGQIEILGLGASPWQIRRVSAGGRATEPRFCAIGVSGVLFGARCGGCERLPPTPRVAYSGMVPARLLVHASHRPDPLCAPIHPCSSEEDPMLEIFMIGLLTIGTPAEPTAASNALSPEGSWALTNEVELVIERVDGGVDPVSWTPQV